MLKRLWIYPTLWLVAMGCAYFFSGSRGALPSPRFVRELGKLTSVGSYFENLPPGVEVLIPEGESELGVLPNDVLEFSSSRMKEKDGYKDSWGNPYRVASEERDGGRWVGVFSTGIDGESATRGNDDDDINSWNQDSLKFYNNWSNRRQEKLRREKMWKVLPIWIIGFLAYYEGISWLRSKRIPKQHTVTF